MTKKINLARQLALMIPAFCFLFNPNIAVIDILPDFIGYIFLTLALTGIADLNENIAAARTAFSRMILLDAGKLLAIVWIFGMEAAGERSSSFLLWSFVFSVIELIVLLPAYQKLFDGLLHIGNLYENTSIFAKARHGRGQKSLTERAKSLTGFFVIVKAALAFLPELADLSNTAYNEGGMMLNLYQYIGTMRALCFLPVLIAGIVWLVRMLRTVGKIRKDAVLFDALNAAYTEKILPKQGMFAVRSIRTAFFALLLGALLMLDFRLDNINLIPDILAFAGFLSFFLFIKKQTEIKKRLWAVALVLFGIFCLASTVAQILFFRRYTYGSLLRNDRAWMLFWGLMAIEIGKALSFFLTVLCTAKTMSCVIIQHTGYVAREHAQTEIVARHVESVQAELRRPLYYMLAATVLYAAMDVAYEMLTATVGFMGLLRTLCGILWIVSVWKAQSEILSAAETKYMLE